MVDILMRRTFVFTTNSMFCFVVTFMQLFPSGILHCVHDSVQEDIVRITQLDYNHHRHQSHHHMFKGFKHRNKRENNQYNPIRIKPLFTFDSEVYETEAELIKDAIGRAIAKTSQILSVIPVNGPLLLGRKPCTKRWTSGINKGKCSQFDGVKPEYCMDYLKIPQSHLKGYAVYNSTHREPFYLKADGPGVDQADYVLYVTSRVTHTCQTDNSMIAYAAYCQLDQNDRPIAGHVNFCPLALRKPQVNKETFYWASLHELFHAFGFSKKLFSKFRKCDDTGTNCSFHPSPVLRPEDGLLKLVTPKVSEVSQTHFQCFDREDFGGPMDADSSSHWDSRIMQGSVMSSTTYMPHLTFIDPLTLALFEDTGWYKVDSSQADSYMWGRGEGCDFGFPNFCETQLEYFCLGESLGCNYLHWDKAKCTTYPAIEPCSVFKSEPGDECWKEPSEPAPKGSLEVFSKNSRCFMANISKTTGDLSPLSPRCFHAHCYDWKTLMVRVDNSSWTLCPAGEYLEIPGYKGYVQCPVYPQNICSGVPRPITTTLATTSTEATTKLVATVPYQTHREKTTKLTSSSSQPCSNLYTSFIVVMILMRNFYCCFQ